MLWLISLDLNLDHFRASSISQSTALKSTRSTRQIFCPLQVEMISQKVPCMEASVHLREVLYVRERTDTSLMA